MTTPIIRVTDVHKSYGRGPHRFDALKGVTFDIHEGESIAIIGKSGSGKSTLMHILALLDPPTSEIIELEGVDTRTLQGKNLNREHGITLIVVTHDGELAARCDRRMYIRDCLLVNDTAELAA